MANDWINVAEAARMVDRSKTVIRRWIEEGWLPLAYVTPGRNGAWLIDRFEFEQQAPKILSAMAERKGGRGITAPDRWGEPREYTTYSGGTRQAVSTRSGQKKISELVQGKPPTVVKMTWAEVDAKYPGLRQRVQQFEEIFTES